MYLKPGMEEEYRRRHEKIWPELERQLRQEGIYDYSIFLDRDTNTLVGVQKNRGETGSQQMGANELVRRWWDYMADIIDVNPDNSPVSVDLPEVFYMEYPPELLGAGRHVAARDPVFGRRASDVFPEDR